MKPGNGIRHVIVDRDGVLNREAPGHGWITRPDAWVWEDGALDGLRLLSDSGLRISVATNQSGVGRGIMTVADLRRVHARMLREAALAGGSIAEVACCLHAPGEGCDCRKPGPGLCRALLKSSGIPAEQTVMVGDAMRDLQAAQAAGILAVLVRTGKGRATESALQGSATLVFDDLHAAARAIVDGRITKERVT